MIALLLIAFLDATTPGGRLDTERQLEEVLALQDVGRVVITHSQGELSVLPTPPGGKAQAELRLSSSGGGPEAERVFLERFSLKVVRDGDTLRIDTVLPPPETKPPEVSYAARLRLWLPRDLAVSALNRYGKLRVEGRDAEVEAKGHLGPVEISDVRGRVVVGSEYDRIRISQIVGDVHVEANSEEILVRSVEGEVHVVNKFGTVQLEDIDGPAWVENRNAPVELIRVLQGVEVTAPYGAVTGTTLRGRVLIQGQNASVKLSDGEGEIIVRYRHGEVEVRDVRGRLEITGDFIPTLVRDVEGELSLITTASSLDVQGVSGNATVEGSTGTIRIVDVRGSLHATGKGGLMEVRYGSWSPAPSVGPVVIELENRASPLHLFLPDEAHCHLTARSTVGVLECDFPGIELRRDGRLATGILTLGKGTVDVHAIGVDARVHVRRTVETERDEEPER